MGKRVLLAVLTGAVALAACSDSPTEVEPTPEPVDAQVRDRDTDDLLADTHGDHWHGSIALEVGEEVEVDVVFLDEDGDEIPLGGRYSVGARFAAGEPDDVISFDPHGDHIDIEGEAEGETRIVLEFLVDGQVEWETPPLRVIVHGGDREPVTAEIRDADTGDVLAYVDDDHWHGSLEVAVGEEIEVDVVFLDEEGEEVPFGGEYSLDVVLAEGEPDDVISFEVHGDHVDIEGESVGETRIIFQFVHGDHVDWETPPLLVTVVDE